MRIIGEYLLHIDAAERAQSELLRPNYANAELGAGMARFKAERDPGAARADMALMPVLSAAQRAARNCTQRGDRFMSTRSFMKP
jgi:hypothetical protein